MRDDLLPVFQTFLRTRMLVPEKNIGFYAHWESRYLAFLNGHPDLKGDPGRERRQGPRRNAARLVHEPLKRHLEEVRLLHQSDLKAGHGEAPLPDALDRKYPNAPREWGWQYVFPSTKLSVDPVSGKVRRSVGSGSRPVDCGGR